ERRAEGIGRWRFRAVPRSDRLPAAEVVDERRHVAAWQEFDRQYGQRGIRRQCDIGEHRLDPLHLELGAAEDIARAPALEIAIRILIELRPGELPPKEH